jgi:hypothetical protein
MADAAEGALFAPTPPADAIPRILHQTYPTKDLPQELRHNVERLIRTNADWQHRLYDDTDITAFITEHYGVRVLRYYQRINPRYGAARADLFRYLLMYRIGGVYLDIKSRSVRPLDDALRPGDRYILSHWKNDPGSEREQWGRAKQLGDLPRGEFQQWHIICAPGHPFLKAVIEGVLRNIDTYRPWSHGTGQAGVLGITGPVAYTLAIQPLLPLHPHRLVDNESELFLEYSYMKDFLHHRLFAKHYTQLCEPVIAMTGAKAAATGAFLAARRAKHRLADLIRKQPQLAALGRKALRLARRAG